MYRLIFAGAFVVLVQALFFTGTAEATVCTTQCQGGYVTENYSCVTDSIYWPGGYYGGGWCGYGAGNYAAGTYYCYGTCQRQVWSSCASTYQVCTHPSASISQSPATTYSGESFSLSWGSSNANSCNVSYSYNGGTAPIGSGLSGTVYPAPVPVGTYSATNACTDSGGETAYASLSHSVVCPAGTSWNGSSCVTLPPTASISQSASQTNSTAPFTISWSSTNASSCTVTYSGPTTPGTISSGPTSGSANLTPQNVGTYTVTNSCTGAGGSASNSLTHTVVCPAGQSWNGSACVSVPTVTVTQTKSSTASKEPFTASWSSTGGATYCNITLSGPTPTETLTNQPPSGTTQPMTPQNLGTYTMAVTCYNGSVSGSGSASHTVYGSDLVAGSVSPSTATVGVAMNFNSTITNSSSYSTIEGFNSYVQFTDAANGGGTVTDGPWSAMPALSPGGSASLSIPFTPSAPGTYSIRACADKSSAGDAGTITESNENNNCSGWTNVVISCPTGQSWNGTSCAAAPTVTLSQSKNPTASKEYFTASWSSTNASTCDITLSGPMPTETISGAATSGILHLTPQNLGTYTMSTRCSATGTSTTASQTHTVNGSDLTAGSITPTAAVASTSQTFSVTISNSSAYSTVNSFDILFQQGTTPTGGTVVDIKTAAAPAIAGNSSVTVSTPFTFGSPGTYYARACADKSSSADTGTTTESNENNNCGPWTTMTVTRAGDKTVVRGTPVSITSTMGGITYCSPSTTYPSLSDNVRSTWLGDTKTNSETTYMTGVLAEPGPYDFTCTNGSLVDTTTLTIVDCASGKVWNGSSCGSSLVSGTLTLPPTCTISAPNASCPANVSWTTQGATGPVTVERAYNPYGTIPGGTGANGSTNVNFAPPGSYTLVLMHGTAELDRKTITVVCESNSNWNGNVCQSVQPQIFNVSLAGNRTATGTLSFECRYSAKYSIERTEGATGSFPMTNRNYNGPVSVGVAEKGNYRMTCTNNSLSDTSTVYFDPTPVFPSQLSILASPRTLNNNKNTSLSWSVADPTNACSLKAEAVCLNGRSNCTASQLSEESSLNSTLTNGTTDANDPYGPNRNIQTAVKTKAPQNNPTGNRALGKKTLLMNHTTDFILDCGTSPADGSVIKEKVRVIVSDETEG